MPNADQDRRDLPAALNNGQAALDASSRPEVAPVAHRRATRVSAADNSGQQPRRQYAQAERTKTGGLALGGNPLRHIVRLLRPFCEWETFSSLERNDTQHRGSRGLQLDPLTDGFRILDRIPGLQKTVLDLGI